MDVRRERERRGEARGRGPRPETKHERDERGDEWHVEREPTRESESAHANATGARACSNIGNTHKTIRVRPEASTE